MKIIIADDQRLLREGLKYILEASGILAEIVCAENGREAYTLCEQFNPDLILMDLAMPVCNGIEATKLIKANYPAIKILILTASNENIDIEKAIANGADGYLLKDIGKDELILSIKSTLKGLNIIPKELLSHIRHDNNDSHSTLHKTYIKVNNVDVVLTPRQLQILKMLVEGHTNRQISQFLFIAEGTVKNNISEIISKLQLKDRTQLAIFAIKHDLV